MVKYLLLILIPISLALAYLLRVSPIWVFLASLLAIIPLAEWIRRSTEQVARIAGPAVGGLLNVTFGNAAELILALLILSNGHQDVVKGQITGAIIGNALLGLGLAVIIGSLRHPKLTFNREHSGQLSSLLILSVIALLLPAIFDLTERGVQANPNPGMQDEYLSLGVSVVLIGIYIANLIYTLITRRDAFNFEDEGQSKDEKPTWGLWLSLAVLIGATVFVAWESELVSNSLTSTAKQLGLSEFFLGVVVLAIIGNISEYVASVYFARQDQMNMAFGITVGSTVQIALLTAPLLVIVSFLIGSPMNLVFPNPIELIAIAGVAFAVNAIAHDGETNWFEGVLLVGVYLILAMAFYLVH